MIYDQIMQEDNANFVSSIKDLRIALDLNMRDTTDHIKTIYQELTYLHDLIAPVFDQLFPGGRADFRKIHQLVQQLPRDKDQPEA